MDIAATREPILVTKRGRPVAQLVPLPIKQPGDWLGALRGVGSVPAEPEVYTLEADDWGTLGPR